MIDERTINRDQLETFNVTLGEEQPVEGISGRRFRVEGVEHVGGFDAQDLQAARSQVCRDIRERDACLQLPKSAFDRDFPNTGDAHEASHITSREMLADRWELRIEIAPQKGEQDMGVQQQAHH